MLNRYASLLVRKHRAPKGALRQSGAIGPVPSSIRQKAPSAKRRIKTSGSVCRQQEFEPESESTERQKVH